MGWSADGRDRVLFEDPYNLPCDVEMCEGAADCNIDSCGAGKDFFFDGADNHVCTGRRSRPRGRHSCDLRG